MIRSRDYVRTLHLIWLKGEIPAYMKDCIMRVLAVHSSGYPDVKLWTDQGARDANSEFFKVLENSYNWLTVEKLDSSPVIQRHPLIVTTKEFDKLSPAIQSDIYRLIILQQKGGIYLDTDYYFMEPIYELIESICDAEYLPPEQTNYAWEETTIIPQENAKGYHCNGLIFCAKPSTPFIEECIKEVLEMPQSLRKAIRMVGPDLIGTMQAKYRAAGGKGLFSIPYAHLHSLQWRDAAKLYEQPNFKVPIPEFIETDSKTHTKYRVYAVHLWNDLVPKDIKIQYNIESRQHLEKLNLSKQSIDSFVTSVRLLECTTNCVPLPELRKGDKYIEYVFTNGKVYHEKISDLYKETKVNMEAHIEEMMQLVVDAVAGKVTQYGVNPVRNAHAYTPIVIALCEYIYQVNKMYKDIYKVDKVPILLCYRDSYLIDKVMKSCTRYSNLDLIPVWMNREIAGKVAGFEGPGYQFEPDYNAYGVANPYHIEWGCDQAYYGTEEAANKLARQYIDSMDSNLPNRLINSLKDSKYWMVFDLSTCHFSAQETFQSMYPEKTILGCYLFTFTRSTNDSYRLRNDYKAWGHITVNKPNSEAMKALENMLSWPHPAMDAGIVGSLDGFAQSEEHKYIIESAVKYINTHEEFLPTIATALKALPDKFSI